MANLYEICDIKEELLRTILTNRDICSLITDKPVTSLPALDLRYTHVYPYSYKPDTPLSAGTFIAFDVYARGVSNGAVKQVAIDLYIFCHYDLMNVDTATATALGISERGTRVDILAAKLDEVINGREGKAWYGLVELDERMPQKPIHPAEHYTGTALSYVVFAANRAGERIEVSDRRPKNVSR